MDKKLIKEQAARLLMEITLTEKEALTEKLAGVIEKFRDNPEKSHALASTVVGFFESFLKEDAPNAAYGSAATSNLASKEDIGLLLLEIQRLRKEIEELKQLKPNV